MPRFIVITVLFVFANFKSFASDLKTGDVLLQPLACWSCNLIEQQENSQFSHIGILIKLGNKDMVLEAYGKVQLVTLEQFISKTEKGTAVTVKRHKDHTLLGDDFIKNSLKYLGNPYDHYFLWDNYKDDKEAMYCSELLYKVMLPYIHFEDLSPKKMLFDVNALLWDRYFRNQTPRNKKGLSPEDFNLSRDFHFIKYL